MSLVVDDKRAEIRLLVGIGDSTSSSSTQGWHDAEGAEAA
jgi:hypothetical protein